MSNIPILYSFRRCPYAMRARMLISMCDIEVELREVHLSNIPKEMSEISPKSTVPVLQFDNGEILEESVDIMDWAINLNDKYDLKYSKEQNIEKTQEILNIIDGPFKFHLDRYKYNTRYIGNEEIMSHEEHRNEALKLLDIIEKELTNKQLWIFSNNPSFIDLAILPFIRQFRIADIEWFDKDMPLKKLHAWLMRFLEWQTFHYIMKKNKPWKIDDEPIYFGKIN